MPVKRIKRIPVRMKNLSVDVVFICIAFSVEVAFLVKALTVVNYDLFNQNLATRVTLVTDSLSLFEFV